MKPKITHLKKCANEKTDALSMSHQVIGGILFENWVCPSCGKWRQVKQRPLQPGLIEETEVHGIKVVDAEARQGSK